jgi:hypothetical protein
VNRQKLLEEARRAVELAHMERYGIPDVNMDWLNQQSDEMLKALIESIYRNP